MHAIQRAIEEVELEVVRGGEELALEATLGRENPAGEKVGFLGVGPGFLQTRDDMLGLIGF